ncbi:MAG: hypothetical protein ABI442_14870 [Gemmatimonadaceae bacterium]
MLGLGRDLVSEKRFIELLRDPRMETVVAAHNANRAAVARSRTVASMTDSTFWPEGVDVDPRTGRFYIASVAHKTIAELSASGATRDLRPRDRTDLGAILGVRVDAKNGVLYATTSDGRRLYLSDYSHGLLRVDLDSHRVIRLDDAPGSASLGCDGIVLYDGTIIAVQNGVTPARIMRFNLDASGTPIASASVLDQNISIADEPTIGTIAGHDFVYAANSQWESTTPVEIASRACR